MKNKSIVVLTTFWNANAIIENGILPDEGIELKDFTVSSIAISHPPLAKLPHLKGFNRIDCLCPTYDMLSQYKSDKNWDNYTKDYHKLLMSRKAELKEWIDSLEPNHVYILCCWENTHAGSNCHRALLYEWLKSSKVAMAKTLPIYRHGNK